MPDFDSGIDLVKSMERLRGDPSSEGKRRFFRELKSARFSVPCGQDNNKIAVLNTPENEIFLPAFTTAQELAKWPFPGVKVAVLPFETLKHIVIDDPQHLSGIVIDPFGKALLLRHAQLAEIDAWTEGMTLKRTDHKGKFRLSITTDYPIGLQKALESLFKTTRNVSRAWILSAQGEDEAFPHKLFLIDFEGDRKKLFPIVAKAVQPFMKPGESFELMKADNKLLQAAQAKAKPVYIK
jgi:hypothetical protein